MSGEKAAVALAVELDERAETLEEQLSFLGLPMTATARVMESERPKGPGRPPGARNKRTIEMVNYLLSQHTSPLEVLARMAAMRIDLLAATLGCTKIEAWQEKRLAAAACLPYLHQKQPLAIDLTNRDVIHLTIVEGGTKADDGSLTAMIIDHIPDEGTTT